MATLILNSLVSTFEKKQKKQLTDLCQLLNVLPYMYTLYVLHDFVSTLKINKEQN